LRKAIVHNDDIQSGKGYGIAIGQEKC